MANKNVTIKRWDAGTTTWDIIYPKTIAENIISGTLSVDRLPTIPVSKLADIPVTKLIEGSGGEKISASLLPSIAITDVTVDTTMTHFLTIYSPNPSVMQEGDVLILTTDNKTYIHNGGNAGTAADFTLLSTPTAAVSSVNGNTGVVVLDKSDVGLGNVVNATMDATPISGSTKYVESGGVYTFVTSSLNGKQNTITMGTTSPSTPADNSPYIYLHADA